MAEEKYTSAYTGAQIDAAIAAINTIDGLLEDYFDEVLETLTGTTTGSGLYISKSTAKVTGGATTTAIRYYSVTSGKRIKLTLGMSSSDSPAAIIAAAAWFSSAPTSANTQGTLAVDKTLAEGVAASPLYLTVPDDVSYLGVSIRTSGGTATAAYVTDSLNIAKESEIEDIEETAETAYDSVEEITTTSDVEQATSTLTGNFYLSTSATKVAGASSTGHLIKYIAVEVGDALRIRYSGDPSSEAAVVGAAYWSASAPSSGSSLLSSAIVNSGSPMSIKDVSTSQPYDVIAPSGASYLCVQEVSGNTTSIYKVFTRVDDKKIATNVEWSVPSTVYAVVGTEKRLYLDSIVKNYDNLILGLPEGHDSGVQLIKNHIAYTPAEAGTKDVTIDAFNHLGIKVGSKTISIVAIANALPENSKRVCIIGDSGTDIQNMAYYMDKELKRMFGDDNTALPTFCGTKTNCYYDPFGTYFGAKPTRYEAHYGKSYKWLATNSDSPLVKNGELDIANWRTSSATIPSGSRTSSGCGLNASETIEVVSLGMGANDTADDAAAQEQLGYLKDIIDAFKADAETYGRPVKFIVQLITLLGTDTRIDKLNSRFHWRDVVLNDTYFANDPDIIIGDMGCCYDRWFAYRREAVTPAPCYPSDTAERIKIAASNGYTNNDTQHPTAEGTQQLGEGVVPALLKMVQDIGTADEETLTTTTPTAVVVPTAVTLHTLQASKADKRTLVDNSSASGAVTIYPDKYHDLGVRDSVNVVYPTRAGVVDGYSIEVTGVSSDAVDFMDRLAVYVSDAEDTAAVSALLAAQAANSGATASYTMSKSAWSGYFSVCNEIDEVGEDTYPEADLQTSEDVDVPHQVPDYARTDEFLFTFEVDSSWGSVTLPSGVVMADGFDWSEAAEGVKFQVSIQDDICLYLTITPSN